MTTPANRFVVGPDSQGRSAVLQQGLTNVQSREACLQGPLPSLHCRRHYDYHSYGLPSSREV